MPNQGNYQSQTQLQPNTSSKWICPDDETINSGDHCIICGCSKPKEALTDFVSPKLSPQTGDFPHYTRFQNTDNTQKASYNRSYLKWFLIAAAAILLVILIASGRAFCIVGNHQWENATCSEAKTCSRCGKVSGEPLGHIWIAATCQKPKTCSRCYETEGTAAAHNWAPATYLLPQTCKSCGKTQGNVKGYIGYLPDEWTEATVDCYAAGGHTGRANIRVLNTPIENCRSVQVNLTINRLTEGNVMGEWGFYVRDLQGKWRMLETFNVESFKTCTKFTFESPVSFDAWTCHCHCLGDSWNFSFTLWLDEAQVY